MNKKNVLPLVASVVLLMAGCSKMGSLSEYVKADPEIAESIGGKVSVNVSATFPEKFFKEKAVLAVTPVLTYEGGETEAENVYFQGEKAKSNYEVIPYETGASVTKNVVFPYQLGMRMSDLKLRFLVTSGASEYNLPETQIGVGVITTAEMARAINAEALIAPDKYQYKIEKEVEQDILFLINKADIRSSELKGKGMSQFNKDVKSLNQKENKDGYTKLTGLSVSAYASPDGTYDFNDALAQLREKNTKSYWKNEMKKLGIKDDINTTYTAQDWEGLKKLVSNTNMEDKDMILRVLSSYNENERMTELKNMSVAFDMLASDVLPQLRRSRLIASYEIIGKTDETILEYVANSPEKLNEDELLYAATLVSVKDNDYLSFWNKKEDIYRKCSELYPESYRAINNMGVAEYAKGNFADAGNLFKKAASMESSCPEVNMNLGLIEFLSDHPVKAEAYITSSKDAVKAGEVFGTFYMMQGKVSEAVEAFGDINSHNSAIAKIVNKDYQGAANTLNSLTHPDNAMTYYLKAIVAARTNDKEGVLSNLAMAKEKNAPMYSFLDPESDYEFLNYLETTKCKKFEPATTK
ncbi:MAG TPA: hypothetical protein DDY68_01465 [Porphyromonadaceae bacterium]|nr:hypothetical protein [Porphyromonadaceae bacterium]